MMRKSRAAGALLGLAVGDALGWPSLYHRSHQLPAWTRRLRRELDAQTETTGAIRPPVPFSLNQPSDLLQLGPTDDAEWAAFTAKLLLTTGGRLDDEVLTPAWLDLANRTENPVKGGISVVAALSNLRLGLRPPATGHDNPHYFDDGGCVRAVAVGIAGAGDPAGAAALAEREAAVTNSLDGLWGARAIAAAVAAACGGATAEGAVVEAVAQLPPESWIARVVTEALTIATEQRPLFAALPILSDRIARGVYSYGTAAPETVALALAIVRLANGNLELGILAASAIVRTADSLPALVGAICGALSGEEAIPAPWRERCRTLQGICLPELAGTDLVDLAHRLVALDAGGRH